MTFPGILKEKEKKRLFLGESLIIGLLGGIFGMGLGILGAEIFNFGVNVLARTLGGQKGREDESLGGFEVQVEMSSSEV